jgi:hypothetical protein
MKPLYHHDSLSHYESLTIATLVAMIAHSPIALVRSPLSLPAGFDGVDVAVLEWIAAEGRRIGRGFAMM